MARTFVVVGESTTIISDFDHCLLEIDEARQNLRPTQRARATWSINWIERILREHVLDIRDEQFLMLLFMMNAKNKDGLDFTQHFFISVGNEIIDMRIYRCTVAMCFLNCWARNQSA